MPRRIPADQDGVLKQMINCLYTKKKNYSKIIKKEENRKWILIFFWLYRNSGTESDGDWLISSRK
jgi:hypothetical protein